VCSRLASTFDGSSQSQPIARRPSSLVVSDK
jgi:hypothetical protein